MKKSLFKRPWFLITLAVVVAGAGGGWYALARSRTQSAMAEAAVQVVTAARGDLVTRVQAPASVNPADEREYRAAFDTQAVSLKVKAGDRVQKGQVLAELDRSAQEAVVRQNRANLANARLQLEQLRLKLEMTPQQQANKLAAAREALADAEDTVERTRQSLDQRGANTRSKVADARSSLELAQAQAPTVTREQVQAAYLRLQTARDNAEQNPADTAARLALTQAEQDYRDLTQRLRNGAEQQRQQVARAEQALKQATDELAELDPEQAAEIRQAALKLNQATRSLDAVQMEIRQDSLLPEQVAGQELAVMSAEQALADQEGNLQRAVIRAEADGIVLSVAAKEANPVQKNALVLVVGRLDQVKLAARVDEADIGSVQVGMKLTAKSGSSPGKLFDGAVTSIAPEALNYRTGQGNQGPAGFQNQGAAVTFPVEALVTNVENRLRPGMSVDTEIETGTRTGVISVGVEALLDKPDGQRYVWVMENDTVQERLVTVGTRAEGRVEITAGLNEGERVIAGPFSVLRSLRPGQKAREVAAGETNGPDGGAARQPDEAPAQGGNRK